MTEFQIYLLTVGLLFGVIIGVVVMASVNHFVECVSRLLHGRLKR